MATSLRFDSNYPTNHLHLLKSNPATPVADLRIHLLVLVI